MIDSGNKIPLLPKSSALKLTTSDRAMGRAFKLPLITTPGTDSAEDIARDTFYSMYKNIPEIRDTVEPSRAVNQAVMKWFHKQGDFGKCRENTIGRLAPAMAATQTMYEFLQSDQSIKEALEEQRKAEELQKRAEEEMKKAAEEAANGNKDSAKKHMTASDQLNQLAQAAANAAVKKVEKASQSATGKVAMKQAVKQAKEAADQTSEFMDAFGAGKESGTETQDDVARVVQAMNDTKKIAEIVARWLGRARGIAMNSYRAEKESQFGSTSEARMTQDYKSLFPTSRAYISPASPAVLRRMKRAELVASGLLGWQRKVPPAHSGQFIAMIDGSGSMSGEPISIARAIGMAIAQVVKEEEGDRRYHLGTFSSNRDPLIECSSEEGWREHLDWCTKAVYGGTDFDKPIERILEVARKAKADGIETVDAMFLTDGWGHISDETVAAFKEANIRLYTVFVGTNEDKTLVSMSKWHIVVPSSPGAFAEQADLIVEKVAALVARTE